MILIILKQFYQTVGEISISFSEAHYIRTLKGNCRRSLQKSSKNVAAVEKYLTLFQ